MEGGVKYWTDYLKVYLAPQSLCLLPGLWQVYSTLHTLSSSLLRFTFVCAVGERSSAYLTGWTTLVAGRSGLLRLWAWARAPRQRRAARDGARPCACICRGV